MLTADTVLPALLALAESRPGFEPANYFSPCDRGDARREGIAAYRADVRAATNALHDVRELARYVETSSSGPAVRDAIIDILENDRDRVSADEKGRVWYTAGQYYCVEFRPAVARLIADAIWHVWADEVLSSGPMTGDKMRQRARNTFPRRIARRYFDA